MVNLDVQMLQDEVSARVFAVGEINQRIRNGEMPSTIQDFIQQIKTRTGEVPQINLENLNQDQRDTINNGYDA